MVSHIRLWQRFAKTIKRTSRERVRDSKPADANLSPPTIGSPQEESADVALRMRVPPGHKLDN